MRLLKKKMVLVEEYTLKCSEDGGIDINVPIDMRNTAQKRFFCPHDDGLALSSAFQQIKEGDKIKITIIVVREERL